MTALSANLVASRERYPNRIALRCDELQFSYAEFDAAAALLGFYDLRCFGSVFELSSRHEAFQAYNAGKKPHNFSLLGRKTPTLVFAVEAVIDTMGAVKSPSAARARGFMNRQARSVNRTTGCGLRSSFGDILNSG